ncbi:MAG: efflux RND transporter periplasmic adaptor subunit [Bryobacteraceae bacterium]|nr:efflux RND transporter periplasmic adaptor subunit [Bryobacteraceae bacterium]
MRKVRSRTQLVAGATAALLLAGCGGHEKEASPSETRMPIAVATVAAEEVEWPAIHEATGTVRARTTATISSRTMGYVREIRPQTGQTVQAGQVLVVIDSRDLAVQVEQARAALAEARGAAPEAANAVASAEAQLELAVTTHGRMKTLYEKKSISDQEWDEAQAKLRVARAARDMAQARKIQVESRIRQAEEAVRGAEVGQSFATITAPFAGIVTERKVEPGVLASPGTPLLTIEQTGAYRLETALEESRIRFVKPGQTVAVALDALDSEVSGRVAEIVPAVDAASRTFLVKIDLPPAANLRSGLFGRARFPGASRPALVAPAGAVISDGQVQSVAIVENGVARRRLVTTGLRREDRVEILTGLSEGERIIFPNPREVPDGTAVTIAGGRI